MVRLGVAGLFGSGLATACCPIPLYRDVSVRPRVEVVVRTAEGETVDSAKLTLRRYISGPPPDTETHRWQGATDAAPEVRGRHRRARRPQAGRGPDDGRAGPRSQPDELRLAGHDRTVALELDSLVVRRALSFGDFMADVGAMLMGRRTYDVVLGFGEWPYGEIPILVPTHRPLDPVRPTVRSVSGSMDEILDLALEAAAGKDVYLDGGELIRQVAELDRIDEYVITMAPVVLGHGIPLFTGLRAQQNLEFVSHRDFGGSMVQITARPRR